MLALAGQGGLDLDGSLDPHLAHLGSRKAAPVSQDGQIVGTAPGTEEKRQVDDAAGSDRSGKEERLHPTGHRLEVDPGKSRSEERRVGKEGRSRWSPYH